MMSEPEFCIQSGLRPGTNLEEVRGVRQCVEQTCYELSRLRVYPKSGHPICLALTHEAAKVQRLAESVSDRFRKRYEKYLEKHGFGQKITEPSEITLLLPSHRVTSGPCHGPSGGYNWGIALKPKDWPALAELVGLSDYDLRKRVSKDDETPMTPSHEEARKLYACLQPLRDRGFGAWISVTKVTTSNILCKLHVGVGDLP